MPAILIYLFKVNIALLLFCLFYFTVLRQLTFYTLNRVYLISCILFSSVYPLIHVNHFVERHEKLVQPLQVVILNINTHATRITQPLTQPDYWEWLVVAFWIGVGLMIIRLFVQFWSLYKMHSRSEPVSIGTYQVRVITENINPFSFWQSIYINPHLHSADELKSIIAHEQVHVCQWHTLDILLAELSLVFYWFNPGVWLMKKAVSENLEFITDRQILQQGADAKSYQYSLLYASFNSSSNAVVNHFNISTIKKRIIMMNTKKSSLFNLTRYGFIAPSALLLLLVFGTSKAALLKKTLHSAKKLTHEVLVLTQKSMNNSKEERQNPLPEKTLIINPQSHIVPKAHIDTTITIKAITDTPKIKNTIHINLTSSDSTYYILNGRPVTVSNILNLDLSDIESIDIINPARSIQLFGNGAHKGVVSITTKQAKNMSPDIQLMISKLKAIVKKDNDEKTGVSKYSIAVVPDDASKKVSIRKNPLFILDGKVIGADVWSRGVNPDSIESINIIKDDSAKKLYGDKAENGVVVITTKSANKKPEKP